jgi:3-oxoacyl-[acyl-carrier protein] reductase
MNTSSADYSGKVALVTGSRRGIGRLIVEYFLRNGATVVGFSRDESTFKHPNYYHLQVDVGNPDAVQKGFIELKKISDSVQIVVNNAAVQTSQYAMVLSPSAAQAMLNTNLMGAFMVSREASKMMRKSKWGRIINVGSMMASLEPIGGSIYSATKAGLATLSNVMAKELAPLNVTCNTMAISAIQTDMMDALPKEKFAQLIATLPIPRLAEPDDIFNVLDFLVSERSSYITAQTIYLGGVH